MPAGADAIGETRQRIEAKPAVAAHAWMGVRPRRIRRRTPRRPPGGTARASRADVGNAECVAGGAGCPHRLRRAAGPLGVGAAGSIHSRSVTPTGASPASTALSSATAVSTPPDIATATRSAAGTAATAPTARATAAQNASTATQAPVGSRAARAQRRRRTARSGRIQQIRPSTRPHGALWRPSMRACQRAVSGARDPPLDDLELDSHLSPQMMLPASPTRRRPERARRLATERVAYDGVGVHPAMVGE